MRQPNLSLITISCLTLGLLLVSCKKAILTPPPQNALTLEKVYADSAGAVAALSNLYVQFARAGGSIESYFTVYPSMYADEIYPVTTSAVNAEYYNNRLTPANAINAATWKQLYFVVYSANLLLVELQQASAISPTLRLQLEGEAYFLRAFAYWLLTNSYGDVPLVLTPEVQESGSAPRAPATLIYAQVSKDLESAVARLPEAYPGNRKTRVNQWAARGLLARVQLYRGDWTRARETALSVVQSGAYSLPSLEAVFKKDSPEALLQFWARDGYTWAGVFIPASGTPAFALTESLLQAFETGDGRREQWVRTLRVGGQDYPHPYKFRNRTITTGAAAEYGVPMRLAEQYLILAEAHAHLDEIPQALQYVNVVRKRAGLSPVEMPLDKAGCLQLVEEERRKEFFTEWGHRFFDLKRNGRLDTVLGAVKSSWQGHARNYPVPQAELLNNPALTQNEGY